MVRGYKEGMEYFLRGEYAQAIDCFEEGTGFGESSECLLMLGKCYEQGLGISRDLVFAKDPYRGREGSHCEDIYDMMIFLQDALLTPF
jgi:TPR repeat protein